MRSPRLRILLICSPVWMAFFVLGDTVHGQWIPGTCEKKHYGNDQSDCCDNASALSGKECSLVELVQVSGVGCVAPQMIRVYEDDFNGMKLDKTFWNADFGAVHGLDYNSNQPKFSVHKEWFLEENVIVKDGVCKLKAIKDPLYNHTFGYFDKNNVWTTATTDFLFKSGGIRSKFHFTSNYGTKIRSRIKLDEANRARYSFWTFGPTIYDNGRSAEIDIFEVYPNFCIDKDRFVQRQQMNTLGYLNNGMDYYSVYVKKHTNGDETFGCQNAEIPSCDLTDFAVYETEYDRFGIRWRTGPSHSQLSQLRYDAFFYNSNGQALDCNNFQHTTAAYGLVTRVPNQAKQDLRFTFYVQLDKDNQGDNDYLTPKYQTMDYVEVYQEVPCLGDVLYNSVDDMGMLDGVYNVRLIHDGELNDVQVAENNALKIIVTGELTINPGTDFDPGAYVDIEMRERGVICNTQAWYQIEKGQGEVFSEKENDNKPNLIGETVLDTTPRHLIPEIGWKEYEEEVKVYPNPGNEVIVVLFPSRYSAASYLVTDNGGKEILRGEVPSGSLRMELNLLYFVPGIYHFVVFDAEGVRQDSVPFIRE